MSSVMDKLRTTFRNLKRDMSHEIELLEVKELSDEQVAYRYRCCGEEMTDSWVTVHVTLPEADHQQAISIHVDGMKTRHEAKVAWRKKMGRA